MCIYSKVSLHVNTRVRAGWERTIQGVSVSATLSPFGTLVCTREEALIHVSCSLRGSEWGESEVFSKECWMPEMSACFLAELKTCLFQKWGFCVGSKFEEQACTSRQISRVSRALTIVSLWWFLWVKSSRGSQSVNRLAFVFYKRFWTRFNLSLAQSPLKTPTWQIQHAFQKFLI